MECAHELVLNGACYYCGSTDLDPQAMSPKPADPVVPVSNLRRRRPPAAEPAAPEGPAASGSADLPGDSGPET